MEYREAMARQIGVLTEEDQEKIRHTAIAIAGVGGTGSASAILAAKAGFGRIVLVDKDRYELVNIVEQLLATTESVGELKAKVAEEAASKHGPFADVQGIVLDIKTVEDVKTFLQGVDYLITAVDSPVTRVVLARAAKEMGIPMIMPANIGWRIINTVYLPDGVGYEELTRQYSFGKELSEEVQKGLEWQQKVSIICNGAFDPDYAEKYLRGEISYISYAGPPAFFSASAAISELLKLVTGKGEVIVAPDVFGFDLLANEPWDVTKFGYRVGVVVKALFTRGMEGAVSKWKELMGYD